MLDQKSRYRVKLVGLLLFYVLVFSIMDVAENNVVTGIGMLLLCFATTTIFLIGCDGCGTRLLHLVYYPKSVNDELGRKNANILHFLAGGKCNVCGRERL